MKQLSLETMEFPLDIWLPFLERRPVVRCSPGYMVYLQGTQATCFYFLKSGRVKSFIQSEDGAERVLTVFEAGSLLGEAAFFDGLPRVSSAVALTPCQLVPIDRELVAQQFAQNPVLAMSMIQYLARKVRMLSDHLDHMAFRPAKRRVAEHLLSLSPDDGFAQCNQEEIAAAVSTSRVTVSRILNELAREGLVELGYRKVRITDREELKRRCLGNE
jgi:CRP/FNR family transcriptional regulator